MLHTLHQKQNEQKIKKITMMREDEKTSIEGNKL